jgi:pimeloyl-ACP methyl ester carboxylesterase
MLSGETVPMNTRDWASLPSPPILIEPAGPSIRAADPPERFATDGPFAESKELVVGAWPTAGPRVGQPGRGRYADVNGLRMYYEVHGAGPPLVLLHGGLTTIDLSFGGLVRTLAQSRKVIAIEQQAHGRTTDIPRTLTYERMADDTAQLLRGLGIERADFFGFSMGGITTLLLAVRYPQLVRKQAVVGAACNNDGYAPHVVDTLAGVRDPDAADVLPPALQAGFARVGAGRAQWRAAVTRMKEVISTGGRLRLTDLREIQADTLFVAGTEGMVRLGHVEEMLRFVPRARVKVFAGDDHDPHIVGRSAALLPMFLETPLRRSKRTRRQAA